MDAEELKKRTKLFALRVLKLAAALPRSIEVGAIRSQLVRAGTSVGANYRAACRSRSRVEFIARIGVVEEEADESAFWMELLIEGGFMPVSMVESLRDEAQEITRIMASSRISAARREKANRHAAIGNRK